MDIFIRYGGGEQFTQPWPIENAPRDETPYVTSDMLQRALLWYGGVTENYWISSRGLAFIVRYFNHFQQLN